MYELYKQYCTSLKTINRYRTLPRIIQYKKSNLDFSSNNYLGLNLRGELLSAAIIAAEKYGIGSTGSRLLSGNNQLIEDFEKRISLDKNTESSLIFNSGFQLNISVLSSLLDSKVLRERPLVFFDRLNHASLYQALLLSKAEVVRYKHNDTMHLSNLLKKYHKSKRPKFIVTETIFGMDGSIASLDKILHLAQEHNSFVYLDEAHAIGIIGQNGYGLSTNFKTQLNTIPHLIMGTFSKALGCSGAYAACNRILKNYLINKTAGFIYTTSNSPLVIGAAAEAWDIAGRMQKERSQLFKLARYLSYNLKNLGFNISSSVSHIVSIIIGQERATQIISDELLKQGIIVSCIRPPTVPPGTSRIRIAINAYHEQSNIDQLINALKSII